MWYTKATIKTRGRRRGWQLKMQKNRASMRLKNQRNILTILRAFSMHRSVTDFVRFLMVTTYSFPSRQTCDRRPQSAPNAKALRVNLPRDAPQSRILARTSAVATHAAANRDEKLQVSYLSENERRETRLVGNKFKEIKDEKKKNRSFRRSRKYVACDRSCFRTRWLRRSENVHVVAVRGRSEYESRRGNLSFRRRKLRPRRDNLGDLERRSSHRVGRQDQSGRSGHGRRDRRYHRPRRRTRSRFTVRRKTARVTNSTKPLPSRKPRLSTKK